MPERQRQAATFFFLVVIFVGAYLMGGWRAVGAGLMIYGAVCILGLSAGKKS